MRHLPESVLLVGFVVGLASGSDASPLWIGNDTNTTFLIEETTTTGAVLRTLGGVGIGFGVDLVNNRLYMNDSFSSATRYNLTTLGTVGAPGPFPSVVSEDMSFDGTNLMIGDYSGERILRINPITGALVNAVSVAFQPLGLTWDGGTGFWADPFVSGGAVTHYNAAGTILSSFTPFPNTYAGGLGYDPADGTLYVGTFGAVYHYTTAGVLLGSFSTGDGRFVDGLEVRATTTQSTVPEPTSLFLLGTGLLGASARRWRKRRKTA